MSGAKYLTISVDDGHATDLRTADLLAKLGLKATFYVPKTNPERPVMSDAEIRQIAQHFELGGHTIAHRSLHQMPDVQALAEITDGKKWLEDLAGHEVPAFCYPQGKFNARTPGLVKQAGFRGARTCMFNLNAFPKNPYLWGLSTHAYSHSPRIQLQHALIEGNVSGALNYLSVFKGARDWSTHFLRALEQVDKEGGIAHLYFHSWEIDSQNEWEKLETTLQLAAQRTNFARVTNGELFGLWPDCGPDYGKDGR